MQKRKMKKGISLIVLVITIIVMIILAAAIILSLNNAGIIGNANKAVDDTNIAQIKSAADLVYAEYLIDNDSISEGADLGERITNTLIERGTITGKDYYIKMYNNETCVIKEGSLADQYYDQKLNIGDYVSYDAGTNSEKVNQYTGEDGANNMATEEVEIESTSSMEWRVLSVEGDRVNLVSAEVVNPKGQTAFSLYGAYSYLKAEEILNNACSVFGNGEHAISARSITMDDIDNITGYDKTEYIGSVGFEGASSRYNVKYGTIMYYDGETKSILEDNTMRLSKITYPDINGENYMTKGAYTLTYNYYSYSATEKLDSSTEEYKMLFRDKDDAKNISYLVATTAGHGIWNMGANFCVGYIGDGIINFKMLFVGGYNGRVEDYEYEVNNSLRPVVTLNGNVMTEEVDSVWTLK